MKPRLGAVVAFIEEKPSHSKYSIKTLLDSLTGINNLQVLAISNGCNVSNSLKDILHSQKGLLFLNISTNIGVPAAWNLGIDLLDCDFIFIMNDDIHVDAVCFDEIVKVFKTYSNTAVAGVEGVVCSKLGDDGFPVKDVKYVGYNNKWKFLKRKNVVDVTAVGGAFFAISSEFIRKTRFRFDTAFTPAFYEEYDLAFFARSHGYKTRIIIGLHNRFDHVFGVSKEPKEIHYLGKSVWSNELAERNKKLLREKWGENIEALVKP